MENCDAKTNLVEVGRKLVVDIIVPIQTFSEQNLNEHWAKKAKRHKAQQKAIHIALLPYRQLIYSLSKHRVVIKLSRIAPRELDKHDNLPYSMKYILDAICENINPNLAKGRADNDPRISVEYDQYKGKVGQYAIQLQIFIL